MSFVTQPPQECRKEHKDKSTQSGAQFIFPVASTKVASFLAPQLRLKVSKP